MTLNITVVGPGRIHQVTDLRLSAFDAGVDGNWVPTESGSPKIITLQYQTWGGFLCYCGIGKWADLATYTRAADWVTALGPQATFDGVAHALQQNGSAWLREVHDSLGRRIPHTFVLAGFEDGHPRLCLVTNAGLHRSGPSDELLTSHVNVSSGVHVIVTGIENAVTKADRSYLKRLEREEVQAQVLRNAMAQINARASVRVEAKNGISESCIAYSINKLLEGAGGNNGSIAVPFAPLQIINGLNLYSVLRDVLPHLDERQIRNIAYSNSASSHATAVKPVTCSLEFDPRGDAPALHPTDLANLNSRHVVILGANKDWTTVGQLRMPVEASPQAMKWTYGGDPIALAGLGRPPSQAVSINGDGLIVGFATNDQNEVKACLWGCDGSIEDLGSLSANNSSASGINGLGEVVGVVYQSPDDIRSAYRRAFRWRRDEGMRLINGLENTWSEAHCINRNGTILGSYKDRDAFHTFIWTARNGIETIAASSGRPFYCRYINDRDEAVGECDDGHGVRIPVYWSRHTGLRPIEAFQPNFHPTLIDNDGNIIGYISSRPFSTAWLISKADGPVELLGGRNHSVQARCIAGHAIFGQASTEEWKHNHPLIWFI